MTRLSPARSPNDPSVPMRPGSVLWPVGVIPCLAAICHFLVLPGRPAHRLSDFFSHTLYQSLIGVALALLLWAGFSRHIKRYFWWPLAVGAGVFACVEGLKRLTRLPRPDGDPTGFPSGHTTFAFALAWLLSQSYPRLTPLWFAIAMMIGWARVEGSAHFPYEVICGAIFGTLIGWLISRPTHPCRDEGA